MIDKKRDKDVLLGYVHNGSIGHCFMESVIATLTENARREFAGTRARLAGIYDRQSPYIHANRSDLARYFLERTDLQWLWMCDTDMQFAPDAVYRLLEAAEEHDIKLVGAAYWNQYDNPEPYLSWLVIGPNGRITALESLERLPSRTDPVEVTALGMGCTIIHRDVLEGVADMYPLDPWDTFAADMLVRFTDGTSLIARTPQEMNPDRWKADGKELVDDDYNPQRMGEDVTFCLRARMIGYPAYGLPTVLAGHVKSHPVRPPRQRDPRIWVPDKPVGANAG